MDSDQDISSDIDDSVWAPVSTGHQPGTRDRSNVDNGRPSAIERQRAAMLSVPASDLTDNGMPQPKRGLRNLFSSDGHNGSRFVKHTRFAFLLVATSLALAFIAFRTSLKEAGTQTAWASPQTTKILQKSPTLSTYADVEAVKGITVPISDVSLRVRPELLQQLVAVFRLRLANAPHDAEVTATLTRLREHGLAELDVMRATEDVSIAANSLKLVTKLFPELVSDPRYQALASRIENNADESTQETTDLTIAKKQPALATTSALSAQPLQSIAPATIITAQQVPTQHKTKPINGAATPVLSSAELSKASAVKTDEPTVALKPEIHVISLTPGSIEGERFVPTEGGNVFLLTINYRNLGNGLNNQPGGELVTQLGNSNNPRLLAEVPIEITGNRGEKSFLIGTFERGRIGEAYKLKFILDGHVLPTRTARLSLAAYVDSKI